MTPLDLMLYVMAAVIGLAISGVIATAIAAAAFVGFHAIVRQLEQWVRS